MTDILATPFHRRTLLATGASAIPAALAFGMATSAAAAKPNRLSLSDGQWRKRLPPSAYVVLRQQGTERSYSSALNAEHRAGTFTCAGCALPLFSSTTKFDSGTGWPSFWAHLPDAVAQSSDTTLGTKRTEIHCARCDGHLGHVFNDGPRPTGLRYCMNGVAMRFLPGRV